MRRESTKQVLARALEELLDEGMSFDRVTVNAIVDRCETSKTTFYNHFKDKYDLMVWYLEGQMKQSLSGYSLAEWRAASVELARGIAEKSSYYQAVLGYEGQNSLLEFMTDYNLRSFSESLRKATGLETLPREYGYAVRAFIAGSMAIVYDWIAEGCQESPEELTEILIATAPRSLAFFFEGDAR